MAQVLRPESIGTVSKSSATQLSIGASLAIIGGQQRQTSTVTISTSTSGLNGLDTGAIAANQFYYAYLVISSGVIGGVLSLSSSSPTGFPAYKLVGQCTTDGSSNLVAANKTMEDNSPIGHVMPAMLTESQFKAVHGNGWVLAAGQSVAGSKYATLTGLTTAPDLRGRTVAGVDNMGGSAANRLTSGGSGITGTTLGAVGGVETHALSTAQMPSHAHGGATPVGGAHRHRIMTPNDYLRRDATGGLGGYVLAPVSVNNGGNRIYADDQNDGIDNPNHSHAINAEGGNTAHQNTQPTMVMNMFIKIN